MGRRQTYEISVVQRAAGPAVCADVALLPELAHLLAALARFRGPALAAAQPGCRLRSSTGMSRRGIWQSPSDCLVVARAASV